MAVVDVKERHERRRSSLRDGKKQHTRVFLVTCDDPQDGTAAALDDHRVPGAGDDFRGVPFSGKDAEPAQNSDRHFEVTVEFAGKDTGETERHPLERPPELSYGADSYTEPFFIDYSDPPKRVVNSALDPFDQYLEREVGDPVINCVLNEADHDPVGAQAFANTVNKAEVTIAGKSFAAYTLRLLPITATRVVETFGRQTIVYWKRSFVLKARADGHRYKVCDVGLNELLPDPRGEDRPKRKLPICDAAGLLVKQAVPLDGQGKRKALPSSTDPTTAETGMVELEFIGYREKDWSSLKICQAATWQV